MQETQLQFIELEKIKYPLVNQFYKRVYKKGLAGKNEAVFALKDKQIICSAKLKTLGEHQLLTGVACDPEHRGKGYASQLITKILLSHKRVIYCFPYAHLKSFYSQLGFVPAEQHTVPEVISSRYSSYSNNRDLLLMIYSPNICSSS
ncbi:GNAT family N-acetyltransferase [Psychromonas ossibalaenae]|uniref:GNAT family N-acetyltransferase n=1 Tax=Psychromonas ossibalaenae TaxID=444922 RepID=UPI000369513A|nr:GNAT family N-acetyltransferase [Psychromonas ossibalaenae]